MSIYGLQSFGLSGLTAGISKLGQHQDQIARSLERLATGKRINRASDDPSGVIASNSLHARKVTIEKLISSFERETSSLGAQEGALSVLSDTLIDLDALTVRAANTGANTPEEQQAFADQAQSLITAIDTIQNTSTFLGTRLLTGFGAKDMGSVQYETEDPETGEKVTATATLADLPTLLESHPDLAQELAQQAASKVSNRRGAIGNRINSLESQGRALLSELTGTEDALSLIEDADFAEESAQLVRSQILEQATIQTMIVQREQIGSMLDLLAPASAAAGSARPIKPVTTI